MQRLILLRHGKAESVAATGGDFERGLTERGRRDAALIGGVLADMGMVPDLALVSTARRARETWEEAAPFFPHARAAATRLLYLATSEQLAQSVADAAETVGCLIIVGHNPGLHDFAVALASRRPSPAPAGHPLFSAFPTAAAAAFRIEPDGHAVFEHLLLPRDHGGGPA
jgi:phosphohistidine phosphatase